MNLHAEFAAIFASESVALGKYIVFSPVYFRCNSCERIGFMGENTFFSGSVWCDFYEVIHFVEGNTVVFFFRPSSVRRLGANPFCRKENLFFG